MPKKIMVRLRAPEGADEANYGEDRFRVDNDGFVIVPKEAVEDLIKTGGFTLPEPEPDPDAPPEGFVKVYHPEGVGCSFEGVSYEPDEDGAITVPAHAVKDLVAHGFSADKA